jgi:hypothetical protein
MEKTRKMPLFASSCKRIGLKDSENFVGYGLLACKMGGIRGYKKFSLWIRRK